MQFIMADEIAISFEWHLKKGVPSPTRKSRDGEASAKPSVRAAVVEAARFLGGQLFGFLRLSAIALHCNGLDPHFLPVILLRGIR